MNEHTIEKVLSALGIDGNDSLSRRAYTTEYENVKTVLAQLHKSSKKTVVNKVYDLLNPQHKSFLDEKILIGSSIQSFLRKPDKIILCATTLGSEVDQLIRKESIMSISTAVLYDTAAMVVIEEALDEWMETLKTVEACKGLYLSARFSPGYGDMPLTMQADILRELDAQKRIGLTVSESNILLPKKSVTAIIGVYKENFVSNYSNCDSCLIRPVCKKRERGEYCGY